MSSIQEGIQEYLEEMKNIQEILLAFLEDEGISDENFIKLNFIFDDQKIHDDQNKLTSLLHLIVKISNNHHRLPNFFTKIDKILQIFKSDIRKYYSNSEIFNIFKSNKRILLFLLEEKVMIIDENIIKQFFTIKYVNSKYPHYFAPEIKPFLNEKWFPNDQKKIIDEINKEEISKDFYENRKIGENEDLICKMIRNDSIEDFIAFVNKNNYSIKSEINPSNFETNSYLLKQQIKNTKSKFMFNFSKKDDDSKLTVIKYATFFGSIQILQYLKMNGVNLTSSLWPFAIHSQNADIVHLLEENHIIPAMTNNNRKSSNSYKGCYDESIKCHHNDFANYFLTNYMQKEDESSLDCLIQSLKNYNFSFIHGEIINESSFFYLCRYGYNLIAKILLNDDIDINKIIKYIFFQHNSILKYSMKFKFNLFNNVLYSNYSMIF